MIKAIFLDIDNTLLSFNSYVRHMMAQGFAHFGLKPYEPYMYDIFHEENIALWQRIEEGTWRRFRHYIFLHNLHIRNSLY